MYFGDAGWCTANGNVQMLVAKAAAYEGTSYKGLFNFVRYIEQLKNIMWIMERRILQMNRRIQSVS